MLRQSQRLHNLKWAANTNAALFLSELWSKKMKMHETPTSIDELILPNKEIEKRVRQYAEVKRKGNILMHGPQGTGKSATAFVIADTIRRKSDSDYAVPIYNAADINDKTFTRFEMDWNWQRISGTKAAYVIIDEVDRLTAQQQIKLRAILDGTELGNVIMTTNNIHNIDKPLADRCDVMEFPPITADNWRSKVSEWLSEAEVLATDEAIDAVLETSNGTIRDLKRGVEDIICEYK